MSSPEAAQETNERKPSSPTKSEAIKDSSSSSSSSSETKEQPDSKDKDSDAEYAYQVLKSNILEVSPDRSVKMDLDSMSEEEVRLFKVVQHLINEGFIDEIELLQLVTCLRFVVRA